MGMGIRMGVVGLRLRLGVGVGVGLRPGGADLNWMYALEMAVWRRRRRKRKRRKTYPLMIPFFFNGDAPVGMIPVWLTPTFLPDKHISSGILSYTLL